MPKIILRKMLEKDLERVAAIEREIFSDPWSINAFKSDLKNEMAHPLVVELDDTVIGYSSIYIVAGEIQIGNFAVASGYRMRGIGRKLMNEIMTIAADNNCDTIFLEVRESNEPAKALYSSFGFKTAGIRKNYYSNPRESALIMVRELKWSTGSEETKKE